MISNEACISHILSTSPAEDTFHWINYTDEYIPSCELRETPLTVQLLSYEELHKNSTTSNNKNSNTNQERRVSFQLVHCNSPLAPPVCSTIALPNTNKFPSECQTSPVTSSASSFVPVTYVYNDMLTFPVCVADVFLDTCLTCRVTDCEDTLIAETSFHIFDTAGLLETGMHVYSLYTNNESKEEELQEEEEQEEEEEEEESNNDNRVCHVSLPRHVEPSNEELLLRELDQGRLQSIPWLDSITYKHVTRETIERQWKSWGQGQQLLEKEKGKISNNKKSKKLIGYVRILFTLVQKCKCPVIFRDATSLLLDKKIHEGNCTVTKNNNNSNSKVNNNIFHHEQAYKEQQLDCKNYLPVEFAPSITTPYVDYDYLTAKTDNLSENFATILSKAFLFASFTNATTMQSNSGRNDVISGNNNSNNNNNHTFMCYEPGVKERAQLNAIANKPPLHVDKLRVEEIELLWRHRFYISHHTSLCMPFLRCVNWSNVHERTAATNVIAHWHHLPLADTLACLSSEFAHMCEVHALAIRQLQEQSDEQLCWIVPQLVQALRFATVAPTICNSNNSNNNIKRIDNTNKELHNNNNNNNNNEETANIHTNNISCRTPNVLVGVVNTLSDFLLDRAVQHWEFCCTLYWTALVEAQLEKANTFHVNYSQTSPVTSQVSNSNNSYYYHHDSKENNADNNNSNGNERSSLYRDFGVLLERALETNAPLFMHRLQQQRRLYNSIKLLHNKVKRGNVERHWQIERGKKLLSEKSCGLQQLFSDKSATTSAAPKPLLLSSSSYSPSSSSSPLAMPSRVITTSSTAQLTLENSSNNVNNNNNNHYNDDGGSSVVPNQDKVNEFVPTSTLINNSVTPEQEKGSYNFNNFNNNNSNNNNIIAKSLLRNSSLSLPSDPLCFLSAKERRSVTLPTHPNLFVRGFLASRFFVFKSSKMPLRLPFWVSTQLNDKEDDFNDEDVYALTTTTTTTTNAAASAVTHVSPESENVHINNVTDNCNDNNNNNNICSTATPLKSETNTVLDTITYKNKNKDEPIQKKVENAEIQSVFTSMLSQEQYKNKLDLKCSDTITNNTNCNSTNSSCFEAALMFKANDDVRQDQLILQLLHMMDVLCKQSGLELCLTPYRVLATGPHDGFVELIPHVVTFQSVQKDVLRYLRQYNETEEEMHRAMERYTRSFAGYSVFSFVLGIGDRHLENILLTRDGRLFHVDFGYILGHDPKPFPPPMKISREMVEVLGGPESRQYVNFKSYCCSAYNILRKHASLFINLLLLMNHASGLPQLTGVQSVNYASYNTTTTTNNNNNSNSNNKNIEPSSSSFSFLQLMKVQQRLRLDLNNAQATQYLQNVIADSVGSLFANLWDALHAAAQATRL